MSAQLDQDTIDIVWEALTDAVYRNEGRETGTTTARYLIEALAERGMTINPVKMRGALQEIETICTESRADLRRRTGTRVGNVLTIARYALTVQP